MSRRAGERGAVAQTVAVVMAAVTVPVVVVTLGVSIWAVAAGEESSPTGGPTSPTTQPTTQPSEDEPAAPERAQVFEDGQFVFGDTRDNTVLEVPSTSERWEVFDAGTGIYYLDENGDPLVSVQGPAIYDEGYCETSDSASRAYVGLTNPARAGELTLEEQHRLIRREWLDALAQGGDASEDNEVGEPDTREVSTPYFDVAWRTDARVTLTGDDPCDPPSVLYTLLSVTTGDFHANVVMVRDDEVDDRVGEDVAEQILETVQPEVPAE